MLGIALRMAVCLQGASLWVCMTGGGAGAEAVQLERSGLGKAETQFECQRGPSEPDPTQPRQATCTEVP